VLLVSCKKANYVKPDPPKTCGFVTGKGLFNGVTPQFEIGEGQAFIFITQQEYDAHKVGDYYCY